jgi:hypothetical protein
VGGDWQVPGARLQRASARATAHISKASRCAIWEPRRFALLEVSRHLDSGTVAIVSDQESSGSETTRSRMR